MKKLVFALNFMDMSRFMNMRSMGYVQLVSLDLVYEFTACQPSWSFIMV